MSGVTYKKAKKQQVEKVKSFHRVQNSMNSKMNEGNPLRDLRFDTLSIKYPELKEHLEYANSGRLPQLNWKSQEALRVLNTVLFKEYFDITWSMPIGNLIPRLPARVNFLLAVKNVFKLISGRNSPSRFFEVCSLV